MKKGRKKSSTFQARDAGLKEALHFRLCHLCLHLNESPLEIVKCEHCQRYLTIEPLMKHLAEGKNSLEAWEGNSRRSSLSEDEEGEAIPSQGRRKGIGLNGLSVVW